MSQLISLNIASDVSSAKTGDVKAFTRLIELTRNTVTSIALAIVKDIDNSEEVAQQVFISLWQNLNKLKNNASFLPWLRQTTRYTAYNFLRDNKVDRKIAGELADILLSQFCHPQLLHEQVLNKEQESLILYDFIDKLPDESQEIVLLYYREEQSSKQVAQLLELSEANVRKILSRVRTLLKQQLLEKYGQLVFSTAPTVGLTSLILSSIITSSPVAAATMASSLATGKTGLLSKLAFLFSGAMIGVLGGVLGVFWGTKKPLEKIADKQAKLQMKKLRDQTMIWVATTGVLFALSYEVTTGWIGPLLCYIFFVLGLIFHLHKMNNFADKHMQFGDSNKENTRRKKLGVFFTITGMSLGLILGFSGLIIGLISSGRM